MNPPYVPHIRWFTPRDIDTLVDIERQSFAEPWTKKHFLRTLRERDCIGMVAVSPREVIRGYFVYQLADDCLHLLNFAVNPECRRIGVGRAMMNKLLYKVVAHNRPLLTVDVIDDNTGMQLFLRACGFKATAVTRGLHAGGEDSYTFEYRPAAEEYAKRHREIRAWQD